MGAVERAEDAELGTGVRAQDVCCLSSSSEPESQASSSPHSAIEYDRCAGLSEDICRLAGGGRALMGVEGERGTSCQLRARSLAAHTFIRCIVRSTSIYLDVYVIHIAPTRE